MRILVWQWGRFGAGPRVAVELAEGLRGAGASSVVLSLAEGAEILASETPATRCEMTVPTYSSAAGFGLRLLRNRLRPGRMATLVEAWQPDLAICAMPALLDEAMTRALARLGIPFGAVIHDADLHPGDGVPLQMRMQRRLIRRADLLLVLSDHVGNRLSEQFGADRPDLIRTSLPPFAFGPIPPPRRHGGSLRLLTFGRLLPYKGLDLLADALVRLGRETEFTLRVVGEGPESQALAQLRARPNVSVENRWVAEADIASLLAWSDALVFPYREASQSGVAAAAISARRRVVSTSVGGLAEQFRREPAALLCEPDADSIAAALGRLLDHPDDAVPDDLGAVSGSRWADQAAALLASLRQRYLDGGRSPRGR